MNRKLKLAFAMTLICTFIVTTVTSAQYAGYGWGTAYQIVNMGTAPADVTIRYYDSSGNEVTAAQRTYQDLGINESRLVIQPKHDTSLANGQMYSAVVFSDQPVAATVNEELYPTGSLNAAPPFASYSGATASEVGQEVFLPGVMYNWFDYYTEIVIMNTSESPAHVTITYTPSVMNGTVSGATGVTETNITIPKYASVLKSQKSLTSLGAPSGRYAGRFTGTAKVTSSDQNITVVVNQHNNAQYKLMTYNGFTSGSTMIAVPSHMRGYWDYYTATSITNMSTTQKACVRITYTPDPTRSLTSSGAVSPVVVEKTIDPLVALMRYDGPGASDDQSDLDDGPVYSRFYGSLLIESFAGTVGGTACTAAPLSVITNVESTATGDSQGGSYTGIPVSQASTTMVSPNILADFWGYYTNLTIQNTENKPGSCTITYTSGPDSSNPGKSKSYTHSITNNGMITVYEGRKGNKQTGDINSDVFWRNAQGQNRFIGSASITCNVKVVGFTNEEKDVLYRDSMYTYNNINVLP